MDTFSDRGRASSVLEDAGYEVSAKDVSLTFVSNECSCKILFIYIMFSSILDIMNYIKKFNKKTPPKGCVLLIQLSTVNCVDRLIDI